MRMNAQPSACVPAPPPAHGPGSVHRIAGNVEGIACNTERTHQAGGVAEIAHSPRASFATIALRCRVGAPRCWMKSEIVPPAFVFAEDIQRALTNVAVLDEGYGVQESTSLKCHGRVRQAERVGADVVDEMRTAEERDGMQSGTGWDAERNGMGCRAERVALCMTSMRRSSFSR